MHMKYALTNQSSSMCRAFIKLKICRISFKEDPESKVTPICKFLTNNYLVKTPNDFEAGFEKFINDQKKEGNSKLTSKSSSIRVTEINLTDKKNKNPLKREYYVDLNDHNNEKKPFSQEDYVVGLYDKYPISPFVEIKTQQFGKPITLMTYKYPGYYNSLYSPERKIKGVVYLAHGLYEYSDLTAYMAKQLSNHGYDVIAMDLRGHGRSEGIKGLLDGRESIVDDYLKLIDATKEEYKDTKKFIMGYSLGGLIANLVNKERPGFLSGMIMLAGAVENSILTKSQKMIIQFLGIFFSRFPKIGVPVPVGNSYF